MTGFQEFVTIAIGVLMLIVNVTTLILTLQRKKTLLFIITVFAAYTVVLFIILHIHDNLIQKPFPYGLLYLPLITICIKGQLFQKIFLILAQLYISNAISVFSLMTLYFFLPDTSDLYYLLLLITVFILYSAYLLLVFRYARIFLSKIFAQGRTAEWALYALSAAIAFFILFPFQFNPFPV